jgi:catechol 2,3-dioxygenase-like lactoylglutathione lyase family enzyme
LDRGLHIYQQRKEGTVNGVLETILYVDDVDRSFRFYQKLFNFEAEQQAEFIGMLHAPGEQALILFPKRIAQQTEPMKPPTAVEGTVPTHDGNGRLHVAFAITADQVEPWERRLKAQGVALEGKVRWKSGGTSLYFRDPDSHLLELVSPGLWSFY